MAKLLDLDARTNVEADAVLTVNGQDGPGVVLNTDDISDTGAQNKYMTVAEKEKLANVEVEATGDQTPEEIREALISLQGSNKLPATAIKDLPTGVKHVIQDEGVSIVSREKLNFKGAGVTVADNANNNSTDIEITATAGGSSGLTVLNNGVAVGTRSRINFIPSDGIILNIDDDSNNDRLNITISASASTPYAKYVTVGSSMAITLSDHGKTLLVTAPLTLTLPNNSIITQNIQVNVRSQTTGTISFIAGSGATRSPGTGNLTAQDKNVHLQFNYSSNVWYVTGAIN
jgi:hypothetical protein